MKWLTWPMRLLGIVLLALLVSGGWLFRRQLAETLGPRRGALVPPPAAGAGEPGAPAALERARDRIDSLHGWATDSVVLTPAEAAALLLESLPAESRRHLDSVTVELGNDRMTLSGRLETGAIPPDQLGPLAGALEPWERVRVAGTVRESPPRGVSWEVDRLWLRDFALPEAASRRLTGAALQAGDGVLPLTLPRGVADLHIRPNGVTLFREETR